MIDIKHIKPSKQLSKYVRKVSIFESQSIITFKQKLTPSAYTYLSYNHKDIPLPIIGKEEEPLAERIQIVGPKIGEDFHVNYNGHLSQILIEFTATGFYYLFHKSPKSYLNKILNLSEFSPTDNSHLLKVKLQHCNDKFDQIEILEKWLIEKSNKALKFCEYIDKAVGILEKANGRINIAELSEQIYKSERQFERQFKKLVGISPKYFSKIIQLHYVINLMQKKEYGSIQNLSYKSNYYDAPSFANKFKELTGHSPGEFLDSDDHIALKYFTELPF